MNGGTYISLLIEPMTPEYAEKAEAKQQEFESKRALAPKEISKGDSSELPF